MERTKTQARVGRRAAAAVPFGLVTEFAFAAAGTVGGPAGVVDRDGLRIGSVSIRVHGVDAPEMGQSCAKRGGGTWRCDKAALDRLTELVAGASVECAVLDRNRYGRLVSRRRVGGVGLRTLLVREGLAWAFIRYRAEYAALEEEARTARRGVWQAATQAPWDHRAGRRDDARTAAPHACCAIKGNISDEGARIYNAAWSSWCARTKIDQAQGERWFCDEAEAVEAGWRPARSRR